MRCVRFLSFGLAAAFSCATTDARAALMAFDGSLDLAFVGGALPALVVTGRGVADVNAEGPSLALHTLAIDGGITGNAAVPVTDPAVSSTLVEVQLDAELGAGTLAPFGSALTQNQLPVSGVLRLCLLAVGCASAIDLKLSGIGAAPGGLGVGGSATYGFGSPISIAYAPWTVGTAWVPIYTAGGATGQLPTFGSAHGPLSLTGSTALPGGQLKLVSPLVISSSLIGSQPVSVVARLSLRFVPEPGLALLLGSGVLALVLIGRRRIQSRRER